MRRYKIFVDAHQFDGGFEGSASFIRGLYNSLVRLRPREFTVILGCANTKKVMAFFDNNPDFQFFGYGSTSRIRRLLYEIPKSLVQLQPDFAHFQYFTPVIKTCPWIVTIHDVLFNDFPSYFPPGYARPRNILFPLSARRANLLTTVSPYSKERISAWYGIDPKRIHVIRNGVDPNRSDRTDLPLADPRVSALRGVPAGYILCVSRFEPRKNQTAVLQAFVNGGFWQLGMSLVFVGNRTLEGGDFDAAFAAAPVGAKDRVVFLEGLSYADVQRLYAHAVAAVYPSFAEGFGMPPLEAAVAGTPSLCAQNTAMSDFTPLAPYFFDANNRAELTHKLRDVIDNRDFHRQQARRIATEVLERFAWDAAARDFGSLIDKHLKVV